MNLLRKEGQQGASLVFYISGYQSSLLIKTQDKANKDILIELSSEEYPMMPKVTRTETF